MRRLLLVAAVVLGAMACGNDSDDTVADPELPPVDPLAIAPLFEDELAEIGVRLTDRGGLVDRSNGYEFSPTGDHVALYVEPVGTYTDEQYVDGIVSITRAVAPLLFATYEGVASFDICQEPRPEEDLRDEPPPVTQIEMTRDQVEAVDWGAVDLVDLLERQAAGELVYLRVSPTVAIVESYARAAATAST